MLFVCVFAAPLRSCCAVPSVLCVQRLPLLCRAVPLEDTAGRHSSGTAPAQVSDVGFIFYKDMVGKALPFPSAVTAALRPLQPGLYPSILSKAVPFVALTLSAHQIPLMSDYPDLDYRLRRQV